MRGRINVFSLKAIGAALALAMLLSFSTRAHAAENFTPGIYVNSADGSQYIVSGATEASTGRTVWTMVNAYNTGTYFSAVWETGAAAGNSILAGSSNIVSYPNGYGPGRAYGVVGGNDIGWYLGNFIAASQTANTITIAELNADGTTANQMTLTLLTQGGTSTASSEQYVSGVYRDIHGYGYLVSGAPSQTGRTVWTIVSMPDNPNSLNAIWESGAAVGNSVLAGSSLISTYPAGYAAGRSYGIFGVNDFGWQGDFLAAVQAGPTICLSNLSVGGKTANLLVLVKDNSKTTSYGTGSENFSPGYYQDQYGEEYLVSGSNESTGRTVWTIASVSMPTLFNAVWETGAAGGNSVLAGSSLISTYPAGYAAGRSYGVAGINSFGWQGDPLAFAQAGNTISISNLSVGGATRNLFVLTKVAGTSGTVGSDSASFIAGNYMDVQGNTFTVSESSNLWSIAGTNGTDFNAQWETGPAIDNTLIGNSSWVTNYPDGYLAGRSYGVAGINGFGWQGDFLAFAQAGNTITLSHLNNSGTTANQFVLIKGGAGGLGNAGTIGFAAAAYYVNVFDGTAKIAVNRTGGGSGTVSAMYSTSAGTATANTDFDPVSGGMLAWSNGVTATKYIDITIPKTASSGVNFTITLSSPAGGVAIGSQKTATVTIINNLTEIMQPIGLWQNAKDLGSGWKWLSWFGYFNTDSSPWIYHMQLGWLYPYGSSTGSIWFYDTSMGAFLWTSATIYPYFYRASDGAWLWYEEGTSGPCWFYNNETGVWEKH